MTKHTLGPLIALPLENMRDIPIVDATGHAVAIVRGEDVPDLIRDANASLFAAAPDLLAACEALLGWMKIVSGYELCLDTKTTERIGAQADAAIAKAKAE